MTQRGSVVPVNEEWFLKNASPGTFFFEENRVGPIASKRNANLNSVLPLAETLRQSILTQVSGWAITKVKLGYKREARSPTMPVLHKYSYMPGVVENVRDIIHNLQRGVFRLPENESSRSFLTEIFSDIPVSSHYKELLFRDLFEEDESSIIKNPEQKILTFQDMGFSLTFEFTVEKGVGHRKAKDLRREDRITPDRESLFSLYVDSEFNPVRAVGFEIESNKLYFRILTNGAVTPEEAYKVGFEVFKSNLAQESL
ncbi:MAG: hypothetical protein JW836_13245 [Deltaproteobacteria bacterium]|nr:hypothetical protein [Deltaproteobacteria bacterium]